MQQSQSVRTVSRYSISVNSVVDHSSFIFSRAFSREYSLLAPAPISSSLGGREGGREGEREGMNVVTHV